MVGSWFSSAMKVTFVLTGKGWLKAELAVSTFWPNEYQVGLQFIHLYYYK